MDTDAAAPPRPSPTMPRETLDYFRGDDLRARVFYDKYALRAPDGTVLERTPDLMWRRIARELASVEATPELRQAWEEKFFWLLEDFRFIPGGRIMHGAGNPKRVTLLNCFPAGTPVQTKRGFVPIQHVLPGDEVLTHRDRFRLVTHVTEREHSEPFVELTCAYLGDQSITSTPNHRFYAVDGSGRPGWVRADELTRTHYVKVDRITETIPLTEIDALNYIDGGALEEDGALYTAMPAIGGNGAVVVKESRRITRRIAVDERFGRWLGYFVAEGGLTRNSVYFTVNKDEDDLATEIVTLTRELFGLDAAIQDRAGQPSHWMRVYVHSKMLVRFLEGFFAGRTKSTTKLLPAWFLRLPRQVQKAFVGAVFAGDGTVGDATVILFLANPDLTRQIYTMLLRLDVVASLRWEGIVRYTRHRGMRITIGTQRYVRVLKAWVAGDLAAESTLADVDHNPFFKVVDGELFLKVRSAVVTPAATAQTVYDLSVEDDHSFTVGWIGAHNCYVLPVQDDSIESIFDWMKQAARTYSLGGGVGTDISVLRPRGAAVNNAARSSTGSVSFMELFSLTTGTIGQSGRRGALMITIADNHPDVLDFVRVKRNLDKVRFANISVRVSDQFMSAVESDREFTLEFRNERAEMTRTIRARDLWSELIRGARDYAEPGLIFWDSIKRWSTSEYNGMGVVTTNPCSLVGSTYVMTPRGIQRLDRLVQDAVADRTAPDVIIDRRAGDGRGVAAVRADALAFTGVKPIYRLETSSGFVIRGTGDHKVKVLNDDTVDPLHGSRGWKRIDELQPGDELAVMDANVPDLTDIVFRDRSEHLHIDPSWIQPRRRDAHYRLINVPEVWEDDLAYLLGYAVGDGGYSTHARRGSGVTKKLDIHMHVADAPYIKPIIDRVTQRYITSRSRVRAGGGGESEPYPLRTRPGTQRAWMSIFSTAFMRMLHTLGLRPAVGHEKTVPEAILTAPRQATAEFLRGLFDADGTVSKPREQPMISLSSSSRRLIEQVQLLLLQFGIFSTVTTYRAEVKNRTRSGLTYVTKAGELREYQTVRDSHKLCIGGHPSIDRFARYIGSALPRKQDAIGALQAWRQKPLRNVTSRTRVVRVVTEGVSEPVYDLTVLDTKSFIANGLVVSNSEIPLEPYGNCCLGNLNLARFVTDAFTSTARVDWTALEPALRYATRFLDNVLDYNADKHPLPQQKEASLKSRRIGVGFTGLGDMLIKLGLKYDTDEAVSFVDQLFERIKNVVYDESVNLAEEKGVFPAYDVEKHFRSPFIHALAPQVQERIRQGGLRNVALLTVPPVGSGAALAGVTSGIEPIFDLSYVRRSESLSQETFKVYHPLVREYMARHEIEHENDLPGYFVTAHQIKAEMRVKMQAAIQKHIDHSISSTVNLPRETTPEEVERIYFLAWKMGLKGITVYREGSREGILLTEQQAQASGITTAAAAAAPALAGPVPAADPGPVKATPRVRPKVTVGRTERVETPRGRIYVVVNEDEWGVNEVFVHSFDDEAEACGRLASLALRAGVDPREVIEQLWRVQSKEVAFDRSSTGTTVRVTTIAQAVALALGRALYGDAFRPDKEFPRADVLPEPTIKARQEALRFVPPQAASGGTAVRSAGAAPSVILQPSPVHPAPVAGGNGSGEAYAEGNGHTERVEQAVRLEFAGVCPDCGETLVHENGCATCRACGFSKC